MSLALKCEQRGLFNKVNICHQWILNFNLSQPCISGMPIYDYYFSENTCTC